MNSQTLIVGIIKIAFSTRPLLFNSFCQNIEIQTSKTQLSTIDLWIIFAVCGVQKNRSKIHTLLSRKYEEETLTGFTLNAAISGYGIALESVFPSLLILGENFFSLSTLCSVWAIALIKVVSLLFIIVPFLLPLPCFLSPSICYLYLTPPAPYPYLLFLRIAPSLLLTPLHSAPPPSPSLYLFSSQSLTPRVPPLLTFSLDLLS